MYSSEKKLQQQLAWRKGCLEGVCAYMSKSWNLCAIVRKCIKNNGLELPHRREGDEALI